MLSGPHPTQPDDGDSRMCICRETDTDTLAGEILRYLRTHKDAADTPRGIARWWIKRQRLEDTLCQVQAALDLLVERAEIDTRSTTDGDLLYRLHRDATPSNEQDR